MFASTIGISYIQRIRNHISCLEATFWLCCKYINFKCPSGHLKDHCSLRLNLRSFKILFYFARNFSLHCKTFGVHMLLKSILEGGMVNSHK